MMLLNHYKFCKEKILVSIIIALLCSSCDKKFNSADVETAMKRYDRLVKKMDADSIALSYTKDGELGGIAKGRDSIRNFLATFRNVKVLSQVSQTSSIKITGDSALQKGNYIQVVVVDNKDTVTVKGEYTANWIWINKKELLIKKMDTKPIK